jgi:hypothetical protein
MRSGRFLSRSLPLAIALSLFAPEARAQNMESTAGAALAVLAWMPPAALGLVSDTAIGIHLVVHDGRVPRTWSLLGTVTWSIAAACWAPVVGVALDSGNYPYSSGAQWGMIAFASTGAAVTLGSLGLSIYGLAHPPDAASSSTRAAATRPFAFAPPRIAPTAGGARLVLQASF